MPLLVVHPAGHPSQQLHNAELHARQDRHTIVSVLNLAEIEDGTGVETNTNASEEAGRSTPHKYVRVGPEGPVHLGFSRNPDDPHEKGHAETEPVARKQPVRLKGDSIVYIGSLAPAVLVVEKTVDAGSKSELDVRRPGRTRIAILAPTVENGTGHVPVGVLIADTRTGRILADPIPIEVPAGETVLTVLAVLATNARSVDDLVGGALEHHTTSGVSPGTSDGVLGLIARDFGIRVQPACLGTLKGTKPQGRPTLSQLLVSRVAFFVAGGQPDDLDHAITSLEGFNGPPAKIRLRRHPSARGTHEGLLPESIRLVSETQQYHEQARGQLPSRLHGSPTFHPPEDGLLRNDTENRYHISTLAQRPLVIEKGKHCLASHRYGSAGFVS